MPFRGGGSGTHHAHIETCIQLKKYKHLLGSRLKKQGNQVLGEMRLNEDEEP